MLTARKNESGFSLIEVLIALIIVSVGFLATARMQIEGLRGSQGAYFNSQANFMVREMTDRMRANPEGIREGHYDALVTSQAAANSLPACISSETVCTPGEIADADLAFLSRYLHPSGSGSASDFVSLLPSGDTVTAAGNVTADGATGVFTVSVSWSERIEGIEETQTMSVQVYP